MELEQVADGGQNLVQLEGGHPSDGALKYAFAQYWGRLSRLYHRVLEALCEGNRSIWI